MERIVVAFAGNLNVGKTALINYDYYRKPEKIDVANEHHPETYYKISLFDGKLEFSPDFQVVWNPNGIDDADTVYVFGTRMRVNF